MKLKSRKSLCALFMVLCMILTVIPLNTTRVYADGGENEEKKSISLSIGKNYYQLHGIRAISSPIM